MEYVKDEKTLYVSQQEKDVWNILYKGRYFQVNNITRYLIVSVINGLSNEKIHQRISLEFGNVALKDSDIELVRNKLSSIDKIKKYHKSEYIKFKKTLLSLEDDKSKSLLNKLSFLFNTKVVIIVLTIFFILLLFQYKDFFCINRHELLSIIKRTPHLMLLYIIISVGIIFIHEMGHAVASERYKVSPKEIGFGFYLYFPVFFTDVSKSWLATRPQRIVIDFAGFYFQIISLTFLLLFSLFYKMPNHIFFVIILDNIFVILYNMNPLFRFDGYWIFSDVFGIANLRNKSYCAMAEIILWIKSMFGLCKRRRFSFPILIYFYSCFSFIFILTMVSTFSVFVFSRLVAFFFMLIQGMIPSDASIGLSLVTTILFSVGGYFLSVSVIQTIKTIRGYVLQLQKESRNY